MQFLLAFHHHSTLPFTDRDSHIKHPCTAIQENSFIRTKSHQRLKVRLLLDTCTIIYLYNYYCALREHNRTLKPFTVDHIMKGPRRARKQKQAR